MRRRERIDTMVDTHVWMRRQEARLPSATNVLILGAGASKHYDFPLAADIVRRVRANTDSMTGRLGQLEIDQEIYERVVARLLSSGCTSVDQFAEYLDNPADILVAKSLVAYHVAIFETRASLSADRPGGHWYELLANHLIGVELDSFPQRDIAIITFNYDRSLEQYLLDCLGSRFGERHSQTEVRDAFQRLPLIHIYGRLGHLPGFGTGSSRSERPYEPIRGGAELQSATAGMHMLRELRDHPRRGQREAARECLGAAQGRVSFLGFAYAQENLEALDLARTCTQKTVSGTVLGIGHDERRVELHERLHGFGVTLSHQWEFDVYTALLTFPRTILGLPR